MRNFVLLSVAAAEIVIPDQASPDIQVSEYQIEQIDEVEILNVNTNTGASSYMYYLADKVQDVTTYVSDSTNEVVTQITTVVTETFYGKADEGSYGFDLGAPVNNEAQDAGSSYLFDEKSFGPAVNCNKGKGTLQKTVNLIYEYVPSAEGVKNGGHYIVSFQWADDAMQAAGLKQAPEADFRGSEEEERYSGLPLSVIIAIVSACMILVALIAWVCMRRSRAKADAGTFARAEDRVSLNSIGAQYAQME